MYELRGIRVMLSEEWKGKMRFINLDDETQYLDIPLEKGIDSKWGDCILENLTGKQQKKPVELFEESLNLTNEQRIALYKYWGKTKVILIKNIATSLEISKREAIEIINLAFKYNLLTQGHNSTWKVIDSTIQDRWIIAANVLERGEKPLNYDMPQTPQESLDKLSRQSTEQEKATAMGEGMLPKKRIIKNSMIAEESPVEVISGNKFHSNATEAKKKEREAYDKRMEEDKKKAIQEMNVGQNKLPISIKKIETIPLTPGKGQVIPKKKP